MRSRFFAAATAVLLTACSGSGGGSTSGSTGTADAGDPVAVLGLQAGACYEFTDSEVASNPAALGMAVESDTTNAIWYLADGGSATVAARTLVYRERGTKRMTDYLYVDGSDLLLLKRDVAGAEESDYQPALVVARLPLKNADHFDESGAVREFGTDAGSDPQPYVFAFDVSRAPVQTPISPDGGFDAFTYAYSGDPSRLQSIGFAVGTGIVQASVGFPDDTGAPVYLLQNTRQLSAGDQTCGSAVP